MCKICDGTSILEKNLWVTCDKLTHIDKNLLHPDLICLSLIFCRNVVDLPELKDTNIKTLELNKCDSLVKLPELKNTKLIDLGIKFCDSLEYIPVLPKSLVVLKIFNCKHIQPSESNFIPKRVTNLWLEDLPKMWLRTLNLSKYMVFLKLANLHINSLTNLPSNLKELKCINCDKVKIKLDELPNLKRLIWHGSSCFTEECKLHSYPDQEGCDFVESACLKYKRNIKKLRKIQRFIKMRLKIRRLLRIVRINNCIQFPDISKIIAGYN